MLRSIGTSKAVRLEPRPFALTTLLALAALAPLGAAGTQAGNLPRVSVSTTSDLDAIGGLPALSDAALATIGGSSAPAPTFTDVHWQATIGSVPTDVDAAARVPHSPPGSFVSLAYSFLSNEAGVRDGDVVVLDGAGGLAVLVSEDALLAGLGRSDADIDVDGLAFDDAGRVLFSLQSDLDASSLGPVEDGDVLRLEASGIVTRLLSEAEVQARFTAATGSSAAIGDVNGLDWFQGEPWVTTQGPTAWDGAVVAVGSFPVVVLDEVDAALGGAELDALAHVRAGDELTSFALDRTVASDGDQFRTEMFGPPSSEHVVLLAGDAGVVNTPMAGGFGRLYLDPNDSWFLTNLGMLGATYVQLDANGRLSVDYVLPSSQVWGDGFASEAGWSFQMLDLNTLSLSAPGRLVRQ